MRSVRHLRVVGFAAVERTMKLTLAHARSMKDVVAAKAVPWITTPDQAMAWGVAFGLDKEIEKVLSRSMVDENRLSDPDATTLLLHPWQPAWYVGAPYSGASGHASTGAGGIFSASRIPDPGSIFAAVGSITGASAPTTSSSSGSSSSFSSGGFGGGGGGGGGGAGRWILGRATSAAGRIGPGRLNSWHGCSRDDGTVLRVSERGRPRGRRFSHG